MSLFLKILDGDRRGAKFSLRDGLVIGRRDTDIILNDSKVSGRHAKVEFRPNGKVFLVDLGSSNGIKVGGHRAREIELLEGMEFVLGRTPIRVFRGKAKVQPSVRPANSDVPRPSGEEIVIEPEEETWAGTVGPLVKRAIREARNSPREIAPFAPVLRMKFIRGIQTGTEWTIGYGPRDIGSGSIDLVLEEAGLPATCFRLTPHHEGALLRADSSIEVRVNGKPVEAEFLRDGDVIEIKNTQIEVEFGTN